MDEPVASGGALRAVLIEAFSDRACSGNGAAVVLLDAPRDDGWLQAVAGSLRQSETAFLLRQKSHWLLRWFTPSCEVPLCGHATLASLLALAHWQLISPDTPEPLRFLTRSGALAARLEPGCLRRGSIDLPSGGMQPATAPEALQALLSRSGLGPVLRYWTSPLGYVVALLEAAAPLQGLASIAAQLEGEACNGLVLMQPQPPAAAASGGCVAGLPVDYRLRFFAPALGIAEDPVTGSAHALVAPWWQERLGRNRVVGWQCSDRPGGVVCEGLGSGTIRLFGSGHLLWDGMLHTQTPAEHRPVASPGSAAAPSGAPDAWQALLQHA